MDGLALPYYVGYVSSSPPEEYLRLGIVMERTDDHDLLERMVFSMFDTCYIADFDSNPFSKVKR